MSNVIVSGSGCYEYGFADAASAMQSECRSTDDSQAPLLCDFAPK